MLRLILPCRFDRPSRTSGSSLRTIFPLRHFIADRIASAKPWRKLNRWAHGNQQIKKLRPDAERSIDVGLGRVEIGRLHLTAWIDDISHVDDLPDFVGPLDFSMREAVLLSVRHNQERLSILVDLRDLASHLFRRSFVHLFRWIARRRFDCSRLSRQDPADSCQQRCAHN